MAKQWGQPTWIFFHTMIEQINEDFYKNNHVMILQYIKNICSILPCPYCQEHANAYMRRIQPRNVATKQQMRTMLFEFHNRVNLRLKKPHFEESRLVNYKTINFVNVVKLFQSVMMKNYILNRAFNEHMMRKNLIREIVQFIKSNIKQFSRIT